MNIEVAADNEPCLVDSMAKGLKVNPMHEPIIGGTPSFGPQAKGVERAVGIAKEGILAFEQHCQCHRTFDVFCDQKRSGTPLERLRDLRGGQKPSSFKSLDSQNLLF